MTPMTMLAHSHDKIRALIREYNEAGERTSEKRDAAEQFVMELQIHSRLVQDILCPAMRGRVVEVDGIVDAACEAYAQIDRLAREVQATNPASDLFEERLQALVGAVEYRFAAEEAEFLPKIAEALRDDSDQIEARMVECRKELVHGLASSIGRWSTM